MEITFGSRNKAQGAEDRLRQQMTKEARKWIQKLDFQIKNPSRAGMLTALQASRKLAPLCISLQEVKNGGISMEDLEKCSDHTLYQKLSQYRTGLENYCIGQVGRVEFEKSEYFERALCSVQIIFQ